MGIIFSSKKNILNGENEEDEKFKNFIKTIDIMSNLIIEQKYDDFLYYYKINKQLINSLKEEFINNTTEKFNLNCYIKTIGKNTNSEFIKNENSKSKPTCYNKKNFKYEMYIGSTLLNLYMKNENIDISNQAIKLFISGFNENFDEINFDKLYDYKNEFEIVLHDNILFFPKNYVQLVFIKFISCFTQEIFSNNYYECLNYNDFELKRNLSKVCLKIAKDLYNYYPKQIVDIEFLFNMCFNMLNKKISSYSIYNDNWIWDYIDINCYFIVIVKIMLFEPNLNYDYNANDYLLLRYLCDLCIDKNEFFKKLKSNNYPEYHAKEHHIKHFDHHSKLNNHSKLNIFKILLQHYDGTVEILEEIKNGITNIIENFELKIELQKKINEMKSKN